jgi:hypothetical protein
MNLIRTRQADEEPQWIGLLFQKGPYGRGWKPLYPLQLPFPSTLQQPVSGGFAYIVCQRHVIAYGRIERVEDKPHTRYVGTKGQPVRSGQNVVIDGPYLRMPAQSKQVEVRGFAGPRYTPKDLHTLGVNDLRKALKAAGVIVY